LPTRSTPSTQGIGINFVYKGRFDNLSTPSVTQTFTVNLDNVYPDRSNMKVGDRVFIHWKSSITFVEFIVIAVTAINSSNNMVTIRCETVVQTKF